MSETLSFDPLEILQQIVAKTISFKKEIDKQLYNINNAKFEADVAAATMRKRINWVTGEITDISDSMSDKALN